MKRGRGTLEDAENNDDEEEAYFLAGTLPKENKNKNKKKTSGQNIAPHERKQPLRPSDSPRLKVLLRV